ncbi:Sugar phosphate isomerase/epimerase [Clostridium acidisoli DSM 12555]|uniref:Sugar phosphate isomerase/epimerase n=1 Tax=Clostridium acidisoli DSM 12555 TaxID=1121291 RepID=A0A1W1XE45_9CLOT|nr:sugar phosphate isomerase/epimerase family protein [Clostridium acidisoli]SMC21781.1 Sugar phosphate isomerase/epimerase [Clostridium acidisoli DSM 12555]
MKYGMPTLIEIDNIENCTALCKELKLDFIELNMNLPQYQIDKIDISKFKSVAKKENVFFTIHLEENLNVCDFNRNVSDAYTKTVLSTIEIAKRLHVPILNMHMSNGVHFTLPKEKVYLFNQYSEIYLSKLKEFRVLCEKAISNSNIKICIENCDGYKDFTKEGIEILLESNVFGLTFDIGHNHSINGIDEPFIKKHIDKLHHMHIHDAIGNKNHLAIGTGEIDIKQKINLAREHNCTCVFETKTINGLKQSVGNLKRYIDFVV